MNGNNMHNLLRTPWLDAVKGFPWGTVLHIASWTALAAIALYVAYEIAALVTHLIPGLPTVPFITTIVRAWIMSHLAWGIVLTVAFVAIVVWLIGHFFLHWGP